MRPKQGPGACGARPLSRHYTDPIYLPGWGCGGPGLFWGEGAKISPGSSLFTPLPVSLFAPGTS